MSTRVRFARLIDRIVLLPRSFQTSNRPAGEGEEMKQKKGILRLAVLQAKWEWTINNWNWIGNRLNKIKLPKGSIFFSLSRS